MRHDEADDDLEGEPGVADALDVKQRRVRVRPLRLHPPRGRRRRRRGLVAGGQRQCFPGVVVVDVEAGDVTQDGHSHVVERLEAERQDRRDDEEHGDARHHLQRLYDRSGNGKHCHKNSLGMHCSGIRRDSLGIICSRREDSGVAVQATAMRRHL